jgi:hypothetical protein
MYVYSCYVGQTPCRLCHFEENRCKMRFWLPLSDVQVVYTCPVLARFVFFPEIQT